MIELVRSWLLGVTGVAILAAMAESLMPQGPVKQVGRLTGGLVLLVAMLTPLLSLDLEEILPVSRWEEEITLTEEQLDTTRKNQLETLIVAELEAYVVDKGAALGLDCSATVTCCQEGEIFVPEDVFIRGVEDEGERDRLRRLLAEDFGISEKKIYFEEEMG